MGLEGVVLGGPIWGKTSSIADTIDVSFTRDFYVVPSLDDVEAIVKSNQSLTFHMNGEFVVD